MYTSSQPSLGGRSQVQQSLREGPCGQLGRSNLALVSMRAEVAVAAHPGEHEDAAGLVPGVMDDHPWPRESR